VPKDRFKQVPDRPDAPARNFANVSPSDTADLAIIPKGMIFGTTGNCVLVGEDGTQATIPIVAGAVYPFCPQRAMLSGHTAGTITLLY
jgi:hypothetical protein